MSEHMFRAVGGVLAITLAVFLVGAHLAYTFELNVSSNVIGMATGGRVCGDGLVSPTEQCDEGRNNGLLCVPDSQDTCQFCSNQCTISNVEDHFCGDGIKSQTEQCDAGVNACEGEGCCTAQCKVWS